MRATATATTRYVQQPLLRKQVNDLPAADQPLNRIGQYETTAVSPILESGLCRYRWATVMSDALH